jgi:flagellar basal-body rod modification protein FlgD
MSAQFAAGQYLQALPMVGHDVLFAGNKMTLAEGKGQYAAAFAGDADHITVKITDADGKLVRTIDTDVKQAAGVATFPWDGKKDDGTACADGAYTVAVTATKGGAAVNTDTLSVGNVSGVVPGNNGTLLQLGKLGIVDLAQILQIN